MKRQTRLFLRSFKISALIIFCALLGILGTAKAYKSIRLIGFGEYREAIEIKNGTIKIFDFEIKLF